MSINYVPDALNCMKKELECAERRKTKPDVRSINTYYCSYCAESIMALRGMYVHRNYFPKFQKYCDGCYCLHILDSSSFVYKTKDEMAKILMQKYK